MPESPFKLSRVALAATNIEAVVNFYQNVFQTTFNAIEMGGMKLYTGPMLGMEIIIAPNEIAGVDAHQSRHQFEVFTTDMNGVIERTLASGGSIRDETPSPESTRVITVVDPDDNTTVFLEQR